MKRTPLRKVSKRRSAGLVKYAKAKREYLKQFWICQVESCFHPAKEIHHKKGRLGALLWDKEYFLAVCSRHHECIHKCPLWSREHGYSLDRLAK